jgi:hypothetical protein
MNGNERKTMHDETRVLHVGDIVPRLGRWLLQLLSLIRSFP